MPQLVHRLLHELAAVCRLTDVTGSQHRFATRLLHPGRGVLGVLLLVEIADQYVRALPRIGDGDRLADAAVRTGDQRHLPGEPTGPGVALLTVIGRRRHLGGGAGGLLLLGRLGHGASRCFATVPTTVPGRPKTYRNPAGTERRRRACSAQLRRHPSSRATVVTVRQELPAGRPSSSARPDRNGAANDSQRRPRTPARPGRPDPARGSP